MRMLVTKINMSEFGQYLQGRIAGTRHYGLLCERLAGAQGGSVVLLDFGDIEYLTGSWLNAMLVEFLKWASDPERDFFPILVNVKDEWLDELLLVSRLSQQCYLVADDEHVPPERARIVGSLEPGEEACLRAVSRRSGVTGAELAQHTVERIGATAWNNRLKAVYLKRLLSRQKQGRRQLYFPVIKEIKRDGR